MYMIPHFVVGALFNGNRSQNRPSSQRRPGKPHVLARLPVCDKMNLLGTFLFERGVVAKGCHEAVLACAEGVNSGNGVGPGPELWMVSVYASGVRSLVVVV